MQDHQIDDIKATAEARAKQISSGNEQTMKELDQQIDVLKKRKEYLKSENARLDNANHDVVLDPLPKVDPSKAGLETDKGGPAITGLHNDEPVVGLFGADGRPVAAASIVPAMNGEPNAVTPDADSSVDHESIAPLSGEAEKLMARKASDTPPTPREILTGDSAPDVYPDRDLASKDRTE